MKNLFREKPLVPTDETPVSPTTGTPPSPPPTPGMPVTPSTPGMPVTPPTPSTSPATVPGGSAAGPSTPSSEYSDTPQGQVPRASASPSLSKDQPQSPWLSQFTPQPPNSFSPTSDPDRGVMAYIQRLYGDPEDDAKRERANKQKLAILAVGDAIRNLGNIYHTTKYAPSQKFNEPVKEEYARQLNEDKLQLARKQKAIEMYQNHAKQQADLYYKSKDDQRKDAAAALAKEEHGWKKTKADDEHNASVARKGYVEQQTQSLKTRDELAGKKQELDEKRYKLQEENTRSLIKSRQENTQIQRQRLALQKLQGDRQYRLALARANKGGGSAGKGKDGKHRIVDSLGDVYVGTKGSMDKKDIAALYTHIKSKYTKEDRAKTEEEMWAVVMRHTDDPYVKGTLRAKGYQYEYSIDPDTGDPYNASDSDDFGEKPVKKKKK